MGHGPDRGNDATLAELTVGDEPQAWAAAGFTVVDDQVTLGRTRIRLVGADRGRGVLGWTLAGLDAAPDAHDLDGLPTTYLDAAAVDPASTTSAAPHPNGTTGLDHVVVLTPDLERTTAALAAVGLACRRVRDTTAGGAPVRQAFFRLGATVLEVVGGSAGREGGGGGGERGDAARASDSPATFFGLAVDVDDLDVTATALGNGLGTVKAAVQPGRRIATIRHRSFAVSVPLAALDRHGDRMAHTPSSPGSGAGPVTPAG